MSWMVKGIPVPILAGLLLLIVGGLIHIVGMATPYWHTVTFTTFQQQNEPSGHEGLWMYCKNIKDTVDCASHEQAHGYIVATRALEVIALLFGIACMCITGLWFFLNITKFKLVFMISSLLSGFASGLFGLIGIIVYAAEINNNSGLGTDQSIRLNYTLGWSFGLCTLSSVIVIIAVVFIAIGIRMKK